MIILRRGIRYSWCRGVPAEPGKPVQRPVDVSWPASQPAVDLIQARCKQRPSLRFMESLHPPALKAFDLGQSCCRLLPQALQPGYRSLQSTREDGAHEQRMAGSPKLGRPEVLGQPLVEQGVGRFLRQCGVFQDLSKLSPAWSRLRKLDKMNWGQAKHGAHTKHRRSGLQRGTNASESTGRCAAVETQSQFYVAHGSHLHQLTSSLF